MILCVANIVDGVVQAVPAPKRHHNIFNKFPLTEGYVHTEQGFIALIEGKLMFINRTNGYEIAKRAGQLEGRIKTGNQDDCILYSEDLW